MSKHTYYGFKLEDAARGLKRALRDQGIPVVSVSDGPNRMIFSINLGTEVGDISMIYHRTAELHPLSRIGDIPMIDVVVDDQVSKDIKPILTMAFLRGGG